MHTGCATQGAQRRFNLFQDPDAQGFLSELGVPGCVRRMRVWRESGRVRRSYRGRLPRQGAKAGRQCRANAKLCGVRIHAHRQQRSGIS